MTTEEAYAAEQKRVEKREKERRFINDLMKCIPLPPKVIDPPKRGYQKQVTCRRCGAVVSECHWNYCPNCGQTLMAASYAGTHGWTAAKADKAFREMMEGRDTDYD